MTAGPWIQANCYYGFSQIPSYPDPPDLRDDEYLEFGEYGSDVAARIDFEWLQELRDSVYGDRSDDFSQNPSRSQASREFQEALSAADPGMDEAHEKWKAIGRWRKKHPLMVAHRAEVKRIKEEAIKSTFKGRGLAVAGVQIELADAFRTKILLGNHNDEEILEWHTVNRYRVLLSPDELDQP